MTDIVLFQLHFSHLPANRLDSLHEERVLVCVTFYVWTCVLNMHVMLLGSTHDFRIDLLSVESPLRMQRAVKEEQPRLSSRLPLAPLPLHL